MDVPIVRQFAMSDFEAVVALWETAGAGVLSRPSDGREQIALKLSRDPDLFLVAVDGEAIVGAVLGGWDGRRGYIYHLAVRAESRRQGIGSRLLVELEERLRRKGALKAKCQIFTDNDASSAFFRRHGYDREPDLYPVGKELVAGGAPPAGRGGPA